MRGAHVIESLQFDVAFASADEAFAQQSRLGSFANGLALEVIGQVFDELSPSGRVWRLDRLDVRLPPLPLHEPDSAWAERLEIGLRQALGQGTAEARARAVARASGRGGLADGAASTAPAVPMLDHAAGPAPKQPAGQAPLPPDLEPLWYWLHHGYLPWQADGRPADAVEALWQRTAPDQREAFWFAAQHSPQRARLLQRWASQGLSRRPDAATSAVDRAAAGADAATITADADADPKASDTDTDDHGWTERLSTLRRHDPGPACWAAWLGALNTAQRHQLCAHLVPATQVGLVEALADSVVWSATTQRLRPELGAARCRAALWGCALSAALQAGAAGFDPARWVTLMLRRWGALVPEDRGWTALAGELDTLAGVASLPAPAWQALRDGLALQVEGLPRRGVEEGSAVSSAEAATAAGPPSTSALATTSEPAPGAGAQALRTVAASPVAPPTRDGNAESRRDMRAADDGTASADTAPRRGSRDGLDPVVSAEAEAVWQQVVRALVRRSGAGVVASTAVPRRPDALRTAHRQRLEPALAAAAWDEVAAVWTAAARADHRWLAARLHHHGRRHVWRQALTRALDDAQFETLLRLWVREPDVQRLFALLATAEGWSLGSRRQPPSWRGLLREWLVDHLLVGRTGAFELRRCLVHLLLQRARWDGLAVHEVRNALVAAFGDGATTVWGAGAVTRIDLDVATSPEGLQTVDAQTRAALHLTDAAARLAVPQAAMATPGDVAPTTVVATPALSRPSTAGSSTWAAGTSTRSAACPAVDGATAEALRTRLDAALLKADSAAASEVVARLRPEDRAWLATRLRQHGRSAAWRAAWAARRRRRRLDQAIAAPAFSDAARVPLDAVDNADADAVVGWRGGHGMVVDSDTNADPMAWLPAGLIDTASALAPPSASASTSATATSAAAAAAATSTASAMEAETAKASVAASASPPSLEHFAQRDRLAALLASPEAAARQVDLLDDPGRRQLLQCLRPDAAAHALAALGLLVWARGEAVTPQRASDAPPAIGPGRDDWRFALRELVEQDRPFEAAGFARRWWATCGAADAGPAGTGQPLRPASTTASTPLLPAREALARSLGRHPAAAQSALARQLQTGLAESGEDADDSNDIEDIKDIERVDAVSDETAIGEPGAALVSFTPPWPDAPGAAEPPPWAGFAALPEPTADTTMYVHNAGLVLLGPYLPMLFSRLGLTEDQAFKDAASAERALHLLQFLCDGSLQPGEHLLLLPKLLCGLDPALPVVRELELREDERAACASLLEAVIAHWRALGKTSVAGLQQTFLQREGALTTLDDEWSLTVESKAFDILIDQLPWGFSTCRFPWMNKVLHVHWR